MKSKYGYEYEVYEIMDGKQGAVYGRFKYLEHANVLCNYLKGQYGTDDDYNLHVRTAKDLRLEG